MHLTRDDSGFTLAEMSIAMLIGAMLLAALASFLVNTNNAGIYTQGMSATINDVRNAMQQMEKETRGSDSITWCEPVGRCLQVGAQTPNGSFQTLRYTHTGTTLEREVFNDGTATWGAPIIIVDRVVNTEAQPVFSCDSETSYLRLTIDLYIEPTPRSDPNLNIQTSIRPRNFLSAANCPEGT
jgi:prepilin-type N-terminal cleavage/methylation domain-containing protein